MQIVHPTRVLVIIWKCYSVSAVYQVSSLKFAPQGDLASFTCKHHGFVYHYYYNLRACRNVPYSNVCESSDLYVWQIACNVNSWVDDCQCFIPALNIGKG